MKNNSNLARQPFEFGTRGDEACDASRRIPECDGRTRFLSTPHCLSLLTHPTPTFSQTDQSVPQAEVISDVPDFLLDTGVEGVSDGINNAHSGGTIECLVLSIIEEGY
ncbi:unnamed protein product [Euphydryas editha]|uniref:Uncharacterized protein n=1 Tax=Euphydryas editha TaxID=104508 RepID=A0AAU9V4I5_EUPED|nr:unnamed protein product [Euphydryas editha]